jgi:hypothetical protein
MEPRLTARQKLSRKLGFRFHLLKEDGSDAPSSNPVHRIAKGKIEILETYPMSLLVRIDRFTQDAEKRILIYVARMIRMDPDRDYFDEIFTYLPLIDNTKYWTEGVLDSIRHYQEEYSWFPKGRTLEEQEAIARFGIASYIIIDGVLEHERFYDWELTLDPQDYVRFNSDRTIERLHWAIPNDRDRWVLTDERLIRFLLEHPYPTSILDVLRLRSTIEYGVVSSVLEHSEPALMGGVL